MTAGSRVGSLPVLVRPLRSAGFDVFAAGPYRQRSLATPNRRSTLRGFYPQQRGRHPPTMETGSTGTSGLAKTKIRRRSHPALSSSGRNRANCLQPRRRPFGMAVPNRQQSRGLSAARRGLVGNAGSNGSHASGTYRRDAHGHANGVVLANGSAGARRRVAFRSRRSGKARPSRRCCSTGGPGFITTTNANPTWLHTRSARARSNDNGLIGSARLRRCRPQ